MTRRMLIIPVFLMGLALTASAQREECDCKAVFDQMIVKLEANYIGLKHFEAQGKGPDYMRRKDAYASRAGSVSGKDCSPFLQEFLDFFEDGHLYVIERPEFQPAELDAIKAGLEAEKIDPVKLKQTLRQQLDRSTLPEREQIIGEYNSGDSELIIVEDGDFYKAYITKSKNENAIPGLLKAKFKKVKEGIRGTYYTFAGAPRYCAGGLYKEGTLLRIDSYIWIKTSSSYERELKVVNFEGGTDWPTIQKIDEDNVLFTIPTFSINYDTWRDVLIKNEELLLNAKNLIVDIRGNRGGNAIYFSFFDLFSDRERKGGPGHALASEDNIAYFSRYDNKIYKRVIKDMKEHMGEIVDGPDYPDGFIKRHKDSKVQRVAILTDGACMSAAESFILHAKGASSLVQTFGSPTAGVIDYTSVNANLLDSGDQNIYLGYPTSTLHKQIPDNGYNQTGIVPDVPIGIEVKDKVAFIVDYFK